MDEETLLIGDYAIHGEEPYTFAHYNRGLLAPRTIRSADDGNGEDGLGRGILLQGEDPNDKAKGKVPVKSVGAKERESDESGVKRD